jgi:lipid-binding SYLF domain-containing protein
VSFTLKRLTGGRYLYRAAWTAPAAIPYRTDAAVSVGTFATALLVTLCLIVLLVGALVFIRRRGWITLPGAARAPAASEGIQVQASRRLSIATTAHVLSYQGSTYLVVESSRGAQATVTRIEPEEPEEQGGEAS